MIDTYGEKCPTERHLWSSPGKSRFRRLWGEPKTLWCIRWTFGTSLSLQSPTPEEGCRPCSRGPDGSRIHHRCGPLCHDPIRTRYFSWCPVGY